MTPPRSPADPASVFLLVEGRHVGVVLPEQGALVEYSYGEWWWFARNEDDWYRAFPAMLWPTRGTLGRRVLDLTVDQLRAQPGVWELRVASAGADSLVARLRTRYESRRTQEVFNPRYGIHFVPDDDDYCVFWNCNDAAAQWLVDLGCEVTCVPIRLGLTVRHP